VKRFALLSNNFMLCPGTELELGTVLGTVLKSFVPGNMALYKHMSALRDRRTVFYYLLVMKL